MLSENRSLIFRSELNITHEVYNSSIAIWTKLALGVDGVDTPYCSFCADDDILFTGALHECFDFLDSNPAFVAVHGNYINFKPGDVLQHLPRSLLGPLDLRRQRPSPASSSK
jgi:hypothetical protein